ncbi:hypothetical protein JKP88DRAFT_310062, partial [Tribonema minus]
MDEQWRKRCAALVALLNKKDRAWDHVFLHPVPADTPDYRLVVPQPRCLSEAQGGGGERGAYATVQEFLADLRLIFANCVRYNQGLD